MTLSTSARSIARRVSDLLGQMTLDEKLAQLGSYWIYDLQAAGELDAQKMEARLKSGIGQVTRLAGASVLDPASAARTANAIQRHLIEHTRLGLPAIIHEECCCGAMVLGGTMFPQMIGLACSFQPDLAGRMTEVIRLQLRAIGAHQGLAPVLDVGRDPRWGRIEETFGEDPILVSQFGMAYIHGLQGDDLRQGVLATGKHFVGHSLSQGGLNCGPVHIGPRELWDVFLAPFQAVIRDAGLASIMCAYPELDGEVVAASRRILTDLLRGGLGFEGLVVSDYHAVNMIHDYHHTVSDLSTAAVKALSAGIDVELPATYGYGSPLKAALEAGEIGLEQLDSAVQRHLQKKFELGLFDDPYVDEGRASELFETASQRALARQLACRSMVLLKNDGLLPIKKDIGTLAVIGPNANNGRNLLGDYSYTAMMEHMAAVESSLFAGIDPAALNSHAVKIITALDGIRQAVSPKTKILYARGCDVLEADRDGFDKAVQVARQAEVVVLVLGDRSGLVPACSTGEFRDSIDLRLPGLQEELAQAVISTGKPVALVLVNGRPHAVPWLAEHANAILEAWLPGEEGGSAIADILFGDVNPGGKLPITFPRHVGQVPVFYNHKPSGMRSHWYRDYVEMPVSPLYPFGHGLSYTEFSYSDLNISTEKATRGEQVEISLLVTNTGKKAGDEVVQLYVCDEYASLPRPLKELKGFCRVALGLGERRRVTFRLPVDMLAFYDENLELVIEAGAIRVMLGSSSEDIRLQGEFEIAGTGKMQVRQRLFVCPVMIE